MPLTQTKDMEAFDHLLNVVFRVSKDGPLYKALMKSGDTDIRDILSLDQTDIDSLTYDRSDTEKDIPLSRWDKVLIKIFKHYILHRSSIGLPIGNDWLSITPEDFGKYRISSDYPTAYALQPTHHKPSKVENSKPDRKHDLSPSMTPKGGKNPSPPTPNHKWAEDAFCHIVTVVFQKTLDSSFVKVLEQEGYTNVISMLSLWDKDISEIPLSISDKHLLTIFRYFHLH